jgi:hypothetical protein
LSYVLILGERLRLLASCLSGGSEGFAKRIPVHDPGCREPETGTDETDCIARGELRRTYLIEQWQAHGPKRFIGEEHDDEGREWKDESAEKARSATVVWNFPRGNEGEDPKDGEREEVGHQFNGVRPSEMQVWERDRLGQCQAAQQGAG